MNTSLLTIRKLALVLSIFTISLTMYAQQGLAESAKKSYDEGNYEQSLEMYHQLSTKFPTSNTYNYRYGVCLYETKTDLETAITHLSSAAKRGYNDAFLELGRCCAYQYYYQRALDNYKQYIQRTRPKGDDLALVTDLQVQAQKGVKLLNRIEKVNVFRTDTVNLEDFYKHYTLSKEVGELTNKIPSDLGKNMGTAFINQKENQIIYAVADGKQKDYLSQAIKFVDEWVKEQKIDSTINTNEDDAYPFIMSDGQTIYFSSKGHDGLGGFDIYTTRLNTETGTYYPPMNLGFPFNSPDDDLLFVIDEYNNIGQFASTRRCPKGKVIIYSFIPNKIKQYLTSEDANYLAKSARLIVDSSNIVPTPILSTTNMNTNTPDFRFEINDNLVYHHANEFRSTDALQKFKKAQQEQQALDWTLSELERERKSVFERKTYDKDKILRMEQQIPIKLQLIKQLLYDARQEEIVKL